MKYNNAEIFINGPDGKLEAKYIQSKKEIIGKLDNRIIRLK